MANQPKTAQRSIRVPDDRWKRAQDRAAEKGESVSEAVNAFLERYGKPRVMRGSEPAGE